MVYAAWIEGGWPGDVAPFVPSGEAAGFQKNGHSSLLMGPMTSEDWPVAGRPAPRRTVCAHACVLYTAHITVGCWPGPGPPELAASTPVLTRDCANSLRVRAKRLARGSRYAILR